MKKFVMGTSFLALLFCSWGCGDDDDGAMDASTDAGTDTDIDIDSDSDTDSDTDLDTDTDTDTDTDSDTDSDSGVDGGDGAYSVGGTVTGLEGGTVELDLNGEQQLDVSADGPFEFASELDVEDDYAVSVSAQPEGRLCSIENESGSSTGADVTDVDVTCVSDDATLLALAVSVGALSPAFDPATTSYSDDVGLFAQTMTVTPTASDDGATIKVNDIAVVSGSESGPITIAFGATAITVAVTAESGATETYTVNANRGFATYMKASNTGTSDQFGNRVAMYGDTIAVGAYGESSSATGINGDQTNDGASFSGAVYVFTRSGSAWTQQAYIKASNTDTSDSFGEVLALHGDTLAVGARYEDSNATGVNGNDADDTSANSGAVYVFTRSGTTWTQQAYIKASNTDDSDNFGFSIALYGDTLAVGANNEDSIATGINGNDADDTSANSGAVYVFTRSGTTWTQQAYIKASNTDSFDHFGDGVALYGDTLAVGASGEQSNATGIDGNQSDDSASAAGAAYIFTRSGTTWTQQAYIKASNTDGNDYFGDSLALYGDTLAVGAFGEDSNATGINGDQSDDSVSGTGAAYVFTRSGTAWTQQAYIKASNSEFEDYFGTGIALYGDTLAVSAYTEDGSATGINGDDTDNSAPDSGAVYVFTRSGTAWSQLAYAKATNTESADYLGDGVALSEDTLVFGAIDEASNATGMDGDQSDNSMSGAGAVYVYH